MTLKRSSNRRTKARQSVSSQIRDYIRKTAEHKFFEVTVSQLLDTPWTIVPLSQGITQGTLGTQRVGDNITYYALRTVGRLTASSTASTANIRFVVALDKMNDSVAPIYSDLFTVNSMDATYSTEQIKAKRFTILTDKTYALNTAGIAGHMFNMKQMLNQVASYNGITSATASNGKNSMWLFVCNDNGTNKPSINCNFQLEFTDL